MIKFVCCVIVCAVTVQAVAGLSCIQYAHAQSPNRNYTRKDASKCANDDFKQCFKITIGKSVYRGCDKSDGSICKAILGPASLKADVQCLLCKSDGCNSGSYPVMSRALTALPLALLLFIKNMF